MELEIHYSGEWAALYVDGRLDSDTVGDSYHAEEKAFELLGVKQIHDDAFMRGHSGRDDVAQTLEEVEEYRSARDNRSQAAEQKRAEAERLLAEAKELDA